MLSFMLWPLRITANVEIEDDRPHRSIRFDTRMNTRSERWKENTISDGTKIDHLPCWAVIYCLGEGSHTPTKGHEYLMFYSPESSSKEPHYAYHSPAFFNLQVFLPPLAFDDLWRMAAQRRIAFHGEIAREELTEKSHDPIRGGSTYEWGADDKMKVVKSFSFRPMHPCDASDLHPSKLAEEYEAKYERHSQMARLCLDIIDQIEREAERRGAKMEYSTCPEGWPDVIRDLDYFYTSRPNPKHLLWSHVEAMEHFAEDRYSEDDAIDLMVSLLKSPWLRCDELELAFVDYMIFWEAFRFHGQVKAALGSRWFSKSARKARARLAELDGAMRSAYFTLRPSGVFSPFQIRAALLHAQDMGAAWNPSVFAMLDRAATRTPPVWIVPK
jgi:hypothetical protein